MLLSICIPTHEGRRRKLERLLLQLLPQLEADDRIEVCISDNASRDGTADLVAGVLEGIGARARYQRHPENLGFTANLLSSVELATGRWCWFLGSDDVVTDTAVAEVAALVDRHPDAAGGTLHRSISLDDPTALVRHEAPSVLPDDPERERELLSEDIIVREMGQLQDFISTQVVRRALWLEVVRDVGATGVHARGRAYPHLLIIGLMIRKQPRWFWYPRETVRQHVGTTAVFAVETDFDPAEWEVRILRDRMDVWADLHGRNSALYRAPLVRTWHRHFESIALLVVKLSPRTAWRSELRLLREAMRAFWWLPRFWVRSVPVLVVPGAGWRALQRVVRTWRRLARTEQAAP